MPKQDKEKVDTLGASHLDGLLSEKNELKVTMKPDKFIDLLRHFNIGKEFSPVAMEFLEDGHWRFRVEHSAGDAAAMYLGFAPVGSQGYLVVEPQDLIKRLGIRYKESENMTIRINEKREVEISDERGNNNEITPLDVSQVSVPKLEGMPHFDKDGWFGFPAKKDGVYLMKDGERVYNRAKTKVTIIASELQKAIGDMKASDRDYVQFHFSKDGCWSRSGHLGKEKSNNKSKTILNADVQGEDLEIILQEVFTDAIKVLNDVVEIYGTPKIPAIVIKRELQDGILVFQITEPKEV